MKALMAIACPMTLLISGCAVSEALNRNLPADTMDRVHLFTRNDDRAANVVERALSTCYEDTEAAMTGCMREALAAPGISVASLIATIPGCRAGSVCAYDYTTRRRIGFLSSYATVVVKDWRVSFDLRGPTGPASAIPVKVADRNLFVVPPPVKITPGSAVSVGPSSTPAGPLPSPLGSR